MAVETVRFLIQSTDIIPTVLPGVTVRVFDALGVLAGADTTDALGVADISLLGNAVGIPYTVRLYKFGISFTGYSPAAISVLSPPPVAGNNFKGYGDLNIASAPSDVRLCRASGSLRSANGDAWVGQIRFVLQKPDIVDGALLSKELTVEADASGYFLVDLFRTGEYIAQIGGISGDERLVTIPDISTIGIADLLFPIVIAIIYNPVAPFAIAAGATLEVVPTVLASDGRTLTGVAHEDVAWTIDDKTIASLIIGTTKLTLRGLSVGSTLLRATRIDDTITRIPNTLVGETAAITVT